MRLLRLTKRWLAMTIQFRPLVLPLYFFLSIIPWIVLTSLLFLKDPMVWPDEAIFVDSAKTLLATGRLATNIFGDSIPGLTQHADWYPPLYFYLLAGWIRMFGASIESVRMLSVIFSFATLGKKK